MRTYLVLASLIVCMLVPQLFAETSSTDAKAQEGKAVVLIVDISPSIKPYFTSLKSVLSRVLIEKRLDLGDYFSLITFSGKPAVADGARIEYARDIDARNAVWSKITPEGGGTDIGSALKLGLETTVDLRNNGFDSYEPLVIFITDGNAEALADSPFYQKTMEEVFADSFIGDKTLYRGWYFVGLGEDLTDIKTIAELAGRKDAFLSIKNPASLESVLDEWISALPKPAKRESGNVTLEQIRFGNTLLKKPGLNLLSKPAPSELALGFVSSFAAEDASTEIQTVSLSFQTKDQTQFTKLAPAWEKGRINVGPKQKKNSLVSLTAESLKGLSGPGTLKLSIEYSVNYSKKQVHEEYTVEFLGSFERIWRTWSVPILLVLVLILAFVAFNILKGYLPVKITMALEGSSNKFKSTSLAVGKKADFGVKPSLIWRLEGNFDPIVGSIKRTGKSSYEIVTRSSTQFASTDGLKPYKLNSTIRLLDQDGNNVNIRFILKK